MFLQIHKKVNIFIVKLIFHSKINVFSFSLLKMNLNKEIKDLLNSFKCAYCVSYPSSLKKNTKKKKYINLNFLFSNFSEVKLNVYKLTLNKLEPLSKYNFNTLLIYKPILIFKNKEHVSKLFLRKSKFFAKTKYS